MFDEKGEVQLTDPSTAQELTADGPDPSTAQELTANGPRDVAYWKYIFLYTYYL